MKNAPIGRRKYIFSTLMILMVMIVPLAFAEAFIYFFKPQPMMWPRLQFSPDYSVRMPPDTVMINQMPRHWRFVYTVNKDGYRGDLIPITNKYDKDNVVVLGDSFSFGLGVNDGEEYPAIMADRLSEAYNIVNLGSAGWGLGQQIRRYFEFGQLFKPSLVIMQFSANDVPDNIYHDVTTVQDGRFQFKSSYVPLYWLKNKLSRSLIQYSQIYNFVRQNLYYYYREKETGQNDSNEQEKNDDDMLVQTYNNLLFNFTKHLKDENIDVIYVAVNNQLDYYPKVKSRVMELDQDGLLNYVEVANWFEGITDFDSPEGHDWGTKAHAIIGNRLVDLILTRSAGKAWAGSS